MFNVGKVYRQKCDNNFLRVLDPAFDSCNMLTCISYFRVRHYGRTLYLIQKGLFIPLDGEKYHIDVM